jgi:hypothetical protein
MTPTTGVPGIPVCAPAFYGTTQTACGKSHKRRQNHPSGAEAVPLQNGSFFRKLFSAVPFPQQNEFGFSR